MAKRIISPCCNVPCSADDDRPIFCNVCLHRADLPREECDCLMCQPLPTPVPEIPDPPAFPIADQTPSRFAFMSIYDPIEESGEVGVSDDLAVQGRGCRVPALSWTLFPNRLILRVDDHANPELWFQVVISVELLARWWRELVLAGCAPDTGE